MRPEFEYYMAALDRWPFYAGVDLSLEEDAPLEGFEHRVHVRLELNHPTADGLCSAEEEALIYAIEQEILSHVSPEEMRLVAEVTHRNARTLVFYCSTAPDEEQGIYKALASVDTHTTKVLDEMDKDWSEYKDVLFPAPNFMHQINDRKVLREFERCGDDCSEVHSIEPLFVQLDENGAQRLASELKEAGFDVKDLAEVGLNGQREWQVTGQVRSPLALSILDDFRQVWLDLADRSGGRYNGWSAEVMPVGGNGSLDADLSAD